ncbi:hypothetical protein AGE04_23545 [Salmonella enterica subsp. enterica serovar Kentucky]|nr:hypothetical protein AGE04_23545 [Salmonella enterica subsp. enterica serovar Kentucky]
MHFRVVFLFFIIDSQNRIIILTTLFTLTLSPVVVHPREIVREAVRLNAAGIILAHNHPSGREKKKSIPPHDKQHLRNHNHI